VDGWGGRWAQGMEMASSAAAAAAFEFARARLAKTL